jgi:hypothetical protein
VVCRRRAIRISAHRDFTDDTYCTPTAVAMLNAIENDHPKIARFVGHIQRW